MTCTSTSDCVQWLDQVPISFNELKVILSTLTSKETFKFSSSSTYEHRPHRSISRIKKCDRHVLPRNQLFEDSLANSFLISSSATAIRISRPDVPEILVPPKRYVSSFKTLAPSTNNKQTQRLNYINDSVMILKLSKEQTNNSSMVNSQATSKSSSLSTTNTTTSFKTQQQSFSPTRLSPILKVEGQKRRIVQHDSSVIVPPTSNTSAAINPMATSASSHPQSNSSVFIYRSAAAGGNTVRQRAIVEPPSDSLLLSAERFKSNLSSTMRPSRQHSITTTYIPVQQTQRNMNQNNRSRIQLEKLTNSRGNYDYVDPFTNCPHDLLNKLAHLTKLQLETIEWEKKKRFTKKKPTTNTTNAFLQGKDSP